MIQESLASRSLEERIRALEKQCRALRAILLSLVVVAIAAFITSATAARQREESGRVLRVRGLIVEDEQGRERILLGAPIPPAANRVRTDLARVKEIWAPRFPKQYMEWYRGYRHHVNGLLILDERGFDRIAVGDPVPDPNIGKRIGPSTGITINDEQGFERSGYGLLKVKDQYRVVLGLDSAKGTEGLTLSLRDDGLVGVTVQDGDRLVYLGNAPAEHRLTGMSEPFQGLLIKQGAEVKTPGQRRAEVIGAGGRRADGKAKRAGSADPPDCRTNPTKSFGIINFVLQSVRALRLF